jgi:hypothetical protein
MLIVWFIKVTGKEGRNSDKITPPEQPWSPYELAIIRSKIHALFGRHVISVRQETALCKNNSIFLVYLLNASTDQLRPET